MKCRKLWVPHQHNSTRNLFIFRVASSPIKKLWVYGIREGGGGVGKQSGSVGHEKGQITCQSCKHVYVYVCSQMCMKE